MSHAFSPFDYYVSLDLGSETMAAYYEHARTGNSGMVDLQAHAKELINKGDPDYLLDEKDEVSPRLRTRIGLNDGRQPLPLPESHALLDFISDQGKKLPGYDECLFTFFFDKNTTMAGEFLPNPKVPFQEGGEAVIPKILPLGAQRGQEASYPAETLLQHLTVQVIRNFVLKSPQLKDVPANRIHLTLTVPNVYSVTHAESIKSFVRQHVSFHDVQVLYESDAVAYFINSDVKPLDTMPIKKFKKRIVHRKGETLRIVTIDIGRGTSDLSLIQIEKPKRRGQERRHYVQARTGKSSGGNGLSYIFAQYYNERFTEMLSAFAGKLPQTLRFNLLEADSSQLQGAIGSEQRIVLEHLENLIREVKANVDENYKLELDEEKQREAIEPIIRATLGAINPNYQQGNDPILDLFSVELLEALVLPAKRFSEGRHSIYWRRLLAGVWKSSAEAVQRRQHILTLHERIEQYVRENVDFLIDQLTMMAVERDNHRNGNPRKLIRQVFDPNHTFVVIAGQAAQFRPIRRAIKERFAELGFGVDNILAIDGSLAKEACCIGAVDFQAAQNKPENPYELHGVYGFLARSAMNKKNYFQKVDMAKVREGGKATVTFDERGAYRLIYSPNPTFTEDQPPELYDGFTALISTFIGHKFDFEYDQTVQEIRVNGDKIDRVANFGDINESIYPKVWPEVIKLVKRK
jgi:hypothetical protein